MPNLERWTIEKKQQVHRLRRQGNYPEEIAQLTGRTKGAINRLLSLEKKRGIIHDKLKPKNLKHDKGIIAQWRELRKLGLTYAEMQEILGVSKVTICVRLAREAQGLLRY